MASKFDKTCIVCSEKYRFCGGCVDYKNKPRWMTSFHNDNCHIIFNTIMEYRAGVKTPTECAEILRGCDLSYRDKIDPNLDVFITEILSKDAAPAEPVIEPVPVEVEEAAVEEAFEKALVEDEIVKPEEVKKETEEDAKPYEKQNNFKYKKSSFKKKDKENSEVIK